MCVAEWLIVAPVEALAVTTSVVPCRVGTDDRPICYKRVMARQGVDEVVVRVVREFGRPARFRDIAERLASAGISRSQVHNAVYRLKTTGRLNGAGSGAQMTYVVAE